MSGPEHAGSRERGMYRTPCDERLSVAAVRDTHFWRISARRGDGWLRAGPAVERELIR